MIIRAYKPEDAVALVRLFYEAVHSVPDYTEMQKNAWAPQIPDAESWNESLLACHTLVAEENDRILGFGNMDEKGYLDLLYVSPAQQRKGVATAICDGLEKASKAPAFTTHASITARPFFENRGYRVIKEQQVERKGIWLTNYVMKKEMRETRC